MKQVMKDLKHLWIILGEESTNYDQVIIDREREDIRFVIGNHVVKVQYETVDNEKSIIRGILVDDIYVNYIK